MYRHRRIPDIGYTRYPDIGYTRYRVFCHLCIRYRVIECSEVVNIAPVIGPGPGAGFPAAADCSDSLGEAGST
jgi:hypothetical protein